MTEEKGNNFVQSLRDHKVPQYLGTYLAVGFGLLQFLEFMSRRYDLSGAWVDKYLLVWLALLPAIATMIYLGGKSNAIGIASRQKWPRVLIIGNVIIALLLGTFMFNGQQVEQGQLVELRDEEGKQIKAMVPNLKRVKTIAVFQFENQTGNKEMDWWGIAFSQLLFFDLYQSPEFYGTYAYDLNAYHDAMGLELFVVPNVGMQREIAQKSRNDYFTDISYTHNDGQFQFEGSLYNSRDGKKIVDIKVVDKDPFTAIDKIKTHIYENIPGAIEDLSGQSNLPASTLLTGNIEALKYLILSRITYYKDPTALEETVALAKKAVELDPTCASCNFYVGDPLYGLGKREESIPYVKKAVKYAASLPERMQFGFKITLYSITGNMEAYWKLQELRRKMFPYEFDPYETLLTKYLADYGIDSAKVLIQEAIDNGNLENGLLSLYGLQLENEEYDAAEKTLTRLTKEFPSRDQDRLKYATIYENQGRLADARKTLLEEEALDPLNTIIQTRLAYVDFKNLEISKANERLDSGISQATTLSDSLNFLRTKLYFLRMTGQIDSALRTVVNYEKFALRRTPLNRLLVNTFLLKADMLQSVGKSQKVPELLAEIDKYSPESTDLYRCMANSNMLERGYQRMTMDLEDYASTCRAEYLQFGKGFGEYFELLESYLSGDYGNCAKILDSHNGKIKKLIPNKYFQSNIYAKSGQPDKAINLMKKAIDEKTDEPIYYYQLAFLIKDIDPDIARRHLNTALKFWAEADEDFIPLQRAKDLMQDIAI